MEQMTENERQQFGEKLAHYAEKKPHAFMQYDSFGNHDSDLFCGETTELMNGSQVRVLISAGVDSSEVIAALKKIRQWIKRDPSSLANFNRQEREQKLREAKESEVPF